MQEITVASHSPASLASPLQTSFTLRSREVLHSHPSLASPLHLYPPTSTSPTDLNLNPCLFITGPQNQEGIADHNRIGICKALDLLEMLRKEEEILYAIKEK